MVLRTGRSRSVRSRVCAGTVALMTTLVAAVSSTADAQTISTRSTRSQIGFTGGASIDPEQGFVGVFWRSPEIGGRLHLRPGIEGGFGNDLRLATINVDFVARFPLGNSGWDFIQGGGPTIVIARFEAFDDQDDTELSAGGSYIIGFGHDSGFLGEFRIGGGGNVPSLKITAGFAFGF
jgi:hypothetical protein